MKKKTGNPKCHNSNAAALRAAAVAALRKDSPKRRNFNKVDLSALVKATSDERAAWMEANKPKFGFCGPSSYDSDELKLQAFTWNCLNEPGSPHFPQPGTTWRDYAPEVLRARLDEAIRHLTYLANSDNKAIKHLVDYAVSATEFLNDMPPKKLRPVARHNFFWPFLEAKKGKSSDQRKRKCLVAAIELGSDVPFSEKAIDRISTSRPAAKEATRLLCRLQESQKPVVGFSRYVPKQREWQRKAAALQPFSPDTWRKWAEVAIESLLDDHNGHPEKNRVLRKIGQSGGKHYEQICAQVKATPKTDASNIRQRIVDSVRDVIRTLADCPRKPRKNAG